MNCALFRGITVSQRSLIKNGVQVLLLGELTLFEARGQYQLIVRKLEFQGQGALQIQYEQLKRKLEAEGFPAPETIVKTGAKKLKEFCRVGYRAEPIYELAKAVFEKEFDPDYLLKEKNIEETRKRLMAFNGIGKYSANHILMLAGHYSDIPIDSEVTGYIEKTYFSGLKVSEKEIFDLFEKYGEWKYLVFKYKRIGRKQGSENRT